MTRTNHYEDQNIQARGVRVTYSGVRNHDIDGNALQNESALGSNMVIPFPGDFAKVVLHDVLCIFGDMSRYIIQ
jgi:hypothetical protein